MNQLFDGLDADTYVYTCTYHGCTYLFDAPAALQEHKNDFHRSQQHRDSALSINTDTTTLPRSPAAILGNSQAGPHKCTKINPSTNKPCNTIFARPYDLTRHEDTIHNSRKQKVRCPMCREEKTFSRNDALMRHMRVIHPEVEAYGKRGRRSEEGDDDGDDGDGEEVHESRWTRKYWEGVSLKYSM